MNAPAAIAAHRVRAADLGDAGERARIDAWLASRPDSTPFHRPAWSRAVERGTGNRAHFLVAERGGEIAGLLPLSEIRSPLFGSALVSAGFAVEGGVLGEGPLAEAAVSLADALGCPGIELRGGAVPAGWRRGEGVYACFARALPPDDEAILKAIPRKQRAEVRKGLAAGLETRLDEDGGDHWRIYAESVRNLGTPVFPKRLFEAMRAEFGADADILTVRRGGAPVASVLSFYHNGTAYPYYGGGTYAARGLRANELLYYELMRHAARRGCTRFEFGRSKLGTGPYHYKRNWGFEERPLVYGFSGAAREVNPMSPRYRLQVAAWKKLPLALANRIGPWIARGLG